MAAVTNQGLKGEHCLVHPETVNKAAFKTYLNDVLLPNLEPGSILVMDNWTMIFGSFQLLTLIDTIRPATAKDSILF